MKNWEHPIATLGFDNRFLHPLGMLRCSALTFFFFVVFPLSPPSHLSKKMILN